MNRTVGFGFATCASHKLGIAWIEKELCFAELITSDDQTGQFEKDLRNKFFNHSFVRDDRSATLFIQHWQDSGALHLRLKGTALQIAVWKQVCKIPRGSILTYSELALRSGYPKAVRAVASAVARNPMGLIIPCHRVVRKSLDIGKYRWGVTRKVQLLHEEGVRIQKTQKGFTIGC